MESNYMIDYYVSVHNMASVSANLILAFRVNGAIQYSTAVQGLIAAGGYITLSGQAMTHLVYGDIVDLVLISDQSITLELTASVGARLFIRSLDDVYYYYDAVSERTEYDRLAVARRYPVRRV
jgi:hypothetical protein